MWRIIVAPAALKMLLGVKDGREQKLLRKRISALAEDPDKQGKALWDELAGYRTVRAVGQRYRIIYKIEDDRVLVYVVFLGRRKQGSKHDVYELARKLFRNDLA